jgi:anaerobic ribonucleoside-triphosphate reductase activating protein
MLRIHHLRDGECPLLGPSLLVWTQGCPRRCPGCCNQSALDPGGPALLMTPEEVAGVWRRTRGGLVLSGGEPFSQATGLARVCDLIRETRPSAPVLAYSGYYLAELLQGAPAWRELLSRVDVLVDGPFLRRRTTDFPLAGSDNQTVYLLSRRVSRSDVARLGGAQVQFALSGGRVRVSGTGARDLDLLELVSRLEASGVMLDEL